MRIDPQNVTLSELLHGRLFRIPAYQRAYSWQDKQRNELFGDLLDLHRKNQEFHFMATVVGVSSGQQELGTDMFQRVDIVDGQQRITTLVLLLKAIGLALPEEDDERQKLDALLVKGDDHTLVLLQSNHDYSDYFVNYLRHGSRTGETVFESQADANLVAGINGVEGFIDTWQKETQRSLLDLLALLKNRLRFIYHQLDNEGIVYTVFEVLNSRGLDVAWLDRCKAVLMGIAFEEAGNRDEMIDELHGIWRRIYKRIGLRQGLSSEALRFAATLWKEDSASKVVSDADALEIFRVAATGDPNKTIEISQFLERVAKALDELLADTQKAAATKIAHARLLAVAIDLKFSEQNKEKLLRQWEHVSFRIFGLSRKDSRTRVGEYVRLARRVYASDATDAFYKTVMEELARLGSDEFSAEKSAACLRNANCYEGWEEELRYFFYARERWLQAQRGFTLTSAVWNKIWAQSASRSIEHILPQTPQVGSHWAALLKGKGVDVDAVCHRLGNLVLLSPPINSTASNRDFKEKIEMYRVAGLAVTDEIASRQDWTIDDIQKREDELVAWATDYWSDVQP